MGKVEYTTVQIRKGLHRELKQYCKEKGFKISGLVETLIRNKIEQQTTKNKKVLKVNSKP